MDERRAIFRKHLVQSAPVIIDEADVDDTLNPAIASGIFLRQQHFMGDDDIGKQLLKEAHELYYGENHFNVRLHWLLDFMTDALGDYTTEVPVASLVKRGITVLADLHDSLSDDHTVSDEYGGQDDPESVHYRHGSGNAARWTQERLQDLFLFTEARQVTLVLLGRGVLDGSDLATHQTMKDISYVVKLLIDLLGDRFAIQKMLYRETDDATIPFPTRSLRSYWAAPTELARRNVRYGAAAFEEVMQIEMEEWTRVFPREIGRRMSREVLI
ncbi:hypothetical protein DL767_007700 [Monosporascus sp. MG133]|nr:hypothetical protein DL767_007700 [Monosporascus sp. MG133]